MNEKTRCLVNGLGACTPLGSKIGKSEISIRKNQVFVLIFLTAFALLVTACAVPQAEAEVLPPAEPVEQLPEVVFDSPAPAETLPFTGGMIVFHAYHAGGMAAVELALYGQPLPDIPQPEPGQPLVVVQYPWTPPGPGSYTLQARAQSAAGAWSAPVELSVLVSGPPSETPLPLPSATPRSTATATPTRTLVRTLTPTMTLTHAPTNPPLVNQVFFLHPPSYTTELVYKGADGCGPHLTEIHVSATHPDGISYVLLFWRFISNRGFDTPWRFHTMQLKDDVLYKSVLNAQDVIDYDQGHFEYQFVAEDVNGEISRSRKYANIDMEFCPE